MSSSNCCFLTCIQISQEADQVVWYSHLFQNFPQFIVIHTVKGFGIVNKTEIDAFLELACFFQRNIKITWNELWTCTEDIFEVSLLHLVQLMLMASLLIIGQTIINGSLWISDHPRLICYEQSSWLWRIRGTIVLAVSPGTTDSSLRIVTADKAWLGRFGMRKNWVDPFKVS